MAYKRRRYVSASRRYRRGSAGRRRRRSVSARRGSRRRVGSVGRLSGYNPIGHRL